MILAVVLFPFRRRMYLPFRMDCREARPFHKLWCWLGAIFGPIALVAVALLPPQEAVPEAR